MATTKRFLYLMDIFLSVLKCDQSNFFHSPLVLSINTIQYYYSTKGQENKGLTDLKNPLVSQSHTLRVFRLISLISRPFTWKLADDFKAKNILLSVNIFTS